MVLSAVFIIGNIPVFISFLQEYFSKRDNNSHQLFSIPLLLQLILHLNYYFHDKDSILTIDYTNKVITLTNNSGTTAIPFDEIKEMIYYKGGMSEEKWGRYVIPSNFYHYTVIKNNKGAKIIFTDFILRDFNLAKIKKRINTRPLLNLT
ncbi:MAG: hypothetical protein M0D53_00120 [Flavobacterium sp. JAD_PAG50586_2]|nr:MAG: hypothetical protein M0D53_00120 [Flavobacterium sp. JAD_PAG50586_2]